MNEAQRAALTAAHAACEAARAAAGPDRYFHCNKNFHEAIYAGSQNGFLQEQAQQLHRRLRPYRHLQLRVRNRLNTSFGEHDAVVQAILAGDPDAASQALRNHVVVQGERFRDLLASLAQLAPAAAG